MIFLCSISPFNAPRVRIIQFVKVIQIVKVNFRTPHNFPKSRIIGHADRPEIPNHVSLVSFITVRLLQRIAMTKAGESNAYDNKIIIVSHYCHFQSTLENNYENDFPFYGIIFVKVLCCNFIPFGNRKKNHFQARYRPQNHFSRKSTYLEHNSYKTYINSHILHINSNQFRQPEVNFVRNIISKPRFEAVRSQG